MNRYVYSKEAKAALESLQQPLAIYQFIDNQVVTLLVSDGFCKLFGFTDRAQAIWKMDHKMYENTHPDDRKRLMDSAVRFASSGDSGEFEVLYRTKAGVASDYRVIHARGKHIRMETGVRLAHIWYMDEGVYIEGDESSGTRINRDMNSVLHEESILRAVNYDALTGLANLPYFFKLGDLRRQRILAEGKQACLLYIDLIGMKYFNYQYGFAQGDQLLVALAGLLAQTFGPEDCCHIGADRFAVATVEDGLEEKLLDFFEKAEKLEHHLPVRVGIYSTRIENVPVSSAYDRAKMACDSIRRTDSSCYLYFSSELSDQEKTRHYILSNIDKAISEKWIKVYCQPIVRAVNGKICDVEALARWIDPELGFLSPASFIPPLEESGAVYKLDLYMLEQVLEKMRRQMDAGFTVISHSINLSRSDFDACDMVEEIRERVDKAGVPRDLVHIEITESTISSNYEYMKKQIEDFRKLGFPVWMDDFGSGYSSLDVLQSVKFDLVKFDMSFMRRLNEGDSARIVLTELMKMAASLGVDTVCEGVETKEQALFLQEIGCSKLQGYYFSKPVLHDEILAQFRTERLIEFEDPETSSYFELIGRINLYDMDVIASHEDNSFRNSFDSIPIGIIEIRDKTARFVRSNPSYRAFMKRFFGPDILLSAQQYVPFTSPFMNNLVKNCGGQGSRIIYDEKMPDGYVVHSFARRIGTNPKTGDTAIAVAVLSISEPTEGVSYADIAQALAADYYNIYVIDLDTNEFIEYTQNGKEEMKLERHGGDFFESARRDTMTRIYEEDRQPFLALFTKENVLKDLDKQGVFTTTYRLIDTGTPMYVTMKISRMAGGNRLILGVSIVDAPMKQKKHYEELQRDREMLVRVMALSDGYLTLLTVDPNTGKFVEYSTSEDFDSLGAAKEGSNFFGQAYQDAFTYCYEEDRQRFQEQFTRENVLRAIEENGIFSINYRLIIKGVPRPVTLKAALFKDGNENKLVIGVRAWKDRQPVKK